MRADTQSAKFSGRGAPMLSRNGQSTISHYICFKSGYTEEELRATGLKQPVADELLEKAEAKDAFKDVRTKLFTNSGQATGEFPINTNILLIRTAIQKQKELERKQNMWPGQNYKYVSNDLFERGTTGDPNDLKKRGAGAREPPAPTPPAAETKKVEV